MNPKALNALISLLDDPDEQVFHQVKDELLTYGTDVIEPLESAWEESLDVLLQERIEDLIHKIQFSNIRLGLREWVLSGGEDLLQGVLFIAHYQYPDLDEEAIKRFINKLAQEIWIEVNPNLTALEQVKVVNRIFYESNQFSGNTANINSPKNNFINQVIESKKGNPVSLAILYIMICNIIDIPIQGVNLPHHFIMAYVDETKYMFGKRIKKDDILFYLNPFNNGYVFDQNSISKFTRQLRLKQAESYFLPCSNIDIIVRLLKNLVKSYKKLGYSDKKEEMESLIEEVNRSIEF